MTFKHELNSQQGTQDRHLKRTSLAYVTIRLSFVGAVLFTKLLNTGADFVYPDFNQTLGLVLNGDVIQTDCGENLTQTDYPIGPINALLSTSSLNMNSTQKQKFVQHGEKGNMQTERTIQTNTHDKYSASIRQNEAQFGHRDSFMPSITSGCKTRLRLTPSAPSKVGAIWYEKRLPVLTGFDTTFSFQVSDHSRVCSNHVESAFSLKHHKSCAVHGGDGLAFVIHGDPNGTSAIGGDGDQLGYGGLYNSLAVEFDMWTNVDTQGSDDVFYDHISIHSGSTGPNSPGSSTALGYWRQFDLADGKVHTARVRYLPYVETKYLDRYTANENLLPFIKDNGEGRRLGTLAVFIDEGVSKDIPILAIPINLSVLLNLPQSVAYAGFTASTGLKWEKHDILSWQWCDTGGCLGDPSESIRFEPYNDINATSRNEMRASSTTVLM